VGRTEVKERSMAQVAVDEHVWPKIILAGSDDQRLDNTDLGD
jgi:hypothetical protein